MRQEWPPSGDAAPACGVQLEHLAAARAWTVPLMQGPRKAALECLAVFGGASAAQLSGQRSEAAGSGSMEPGLAPALWSHFLAPQLLRLKGTTSVAGSAFMTPGIIRGRSLSSTHSSPAQAMLP